MLPTPASPLQFTIVRQIDADIDTVFDVLSSEAGMKAWITGCRSVEWRHPQGATRPSVGSVRHIVLAGGLVAAERMLAWQAGRELHYTFDQSSIPVARFARNYVGVTRLDALAGAKNLTQLTWAIHFEGSSAFAAAVVRAVLRPAITLMAGNIARIAAARRG